MQSFNLSFDLLVVGICVSVVVVVAADTDFIALITLQTPDMGRR